MRQVTLKHLNFLLLWAIVSSFSPNVPSASINHKIRIDLWAAATAEEAEEEERKLRLTVEQLRREITSLTDDSAIETSGSSNSLAPTLEQVRDCNDDYGVQLRMVPGEPLAGSRWDIAIDLGREKGSWMPPSWASRGERYICTLENVGFDGTLFAAGVRQAGSFGTRSDDGTGEKAMRDFLQRGGGAVRRIVFGGRGGGSSSDSGGGGGGGGGGGVSSGRTTTFAKVRGWDRLPISPGGWSRAGGTRDGTFRWCAVLPDGIDSRTPGAVSGTTGLGDGRESTLTLPPGEVLYFATPAWGTMLSNKGGVVSVRRNAIWRTEYRIVGTWQAARRS